MDRPTDEDLAQLSEAERAAVEADDESDTYAELAADTEATAESKAEAASETTQAAGEAKTEAEKPAEPQAEAFEAPYRAEAPADAAQKLGELQGKVDEAFAKLMNGDLTAEEYKAQAGEAQRQIEELRTAQLKAQIAAEMSAQAAQQSWDRACQRFADYAKQTDGVDYFGNPVLGAAWDYEIKRLANDQANADKGADFFLREAHAAVLKAIGREPGKQPVREVAKAESRKPDLSGVPPSLAKVPPAMEPPVGEDEFAHLRNLDGDDYEKAVARIEADPDKYARFIATA